MISYHVGQTYQSTEAREREDFYDTGLATPFVIFNGTYVAWEQNPSNYDSVFTENIEAARTQPPYFNIYVDSAYASPSTGTFDLRIITADTIPEGNVVGFIAVLEDSLPGAYTEFMHVCRALYQFPVTLVYPDTLDTTITFSHSIPPHNLKTVVFIQDLDTKEVMQAQITGFMEE